MKIRKKYSITILHFRNLAILTKRPNRWVDWIQRNATCGATIYDCDFNESVHNLKLLSKNGVAISKRRKTMIAYKLIRKMKDGSLSP